MKKGQILSGIVKRVDFPNKGIVETEEGICVVKNVLPGQRISFVVQKKRSGRAEGKLLHIEEVSPLEKKSPCPHFGECGGCNYLSLSYEEQLKIKEEQVHKLLADALSGQEHEWQFEGIKGSPVHTGYRNKMEFSFGDAYKDGPLSLGMHKRGSYYDIVTVSGCQIVDEDYRRILTFTRDFFDGCSFYHRIRHTGYLRHLLVRKAAHTGEILIALVTTSQQDFGGADCGEQRNIFSEESEKLNAWKDKLLNLELTKEITGKITGVIHIINDSVADVIQSDRMDILYGQDFLYEELLGLRFKISVFSFFQTNSLGAEVLYETVREYVGDLNADKEEGLACERAFAGLFQETFEDGLAGQGKVVFDLYSGTGTIAQLIAPVAQKVIGVEIVEEAVEAARKNAEMNGLHNCKFIAGDVLKVLDEIEEKPDMIVLDPPRDGVHPKALKKIIGYGIDRLVYISCKPTSLVRDLQVFLENGYVVERAVAVDQFPWTANVETCVLLSRKRSTTRIEIEMDLTEADRRECIGKATYQEIADYVMEHYQAHVSRLYIAQIKRKCGLDVGESYNKPKSENPKVPNCPPEKEKMIREALKFYGMIK